MESISALQTFRHKDYILAFLPPLWMHLKPRPHIIRENWKLCYIWSSLLWYHTSSTTNVKVKKDSGGAYEKPKARRETKCKRIRCFC